MDRRNRYSEETRIEVAQQFELGYSYGAVAIFLGLPPGIVRNWQDAHRQDRLLNSGLVREKRKYSQELKVEGVEKFLAGTPKSDVIAEFGISTRTLFNTWVATGLCQETWTVLRSLCDLIMPRNSRRSSEQARR